MQTFSLYLRLCELNWNLGTGSSLSQETRMKILKDSCNTFS